MATFDYVITLLEAKGWYLYEAKRQVSIPEVISAGRVRALRPDVYYYLLPATSHDASVEEMLAAMTEAEWTKMMPTYRDGANTGMVDGIYITDGKFAFVSKPNQFVFRLESRAAIEDAIKFNLSNHNTLFFASIDEVETFIKQKGIAPQRPSALPSQLRWVYARSSDDLDMTVIYPENPGDVLFRGQGKRYLPCLPTVARGMGVAARRIDELSEMQQAHLFVSLIRTQWFISLLRETSAAKWLRQNNLVVDEMAVAQHYGLPTAYLDLTQSFEVAAFFACAQFDASSKAWTPVTEGEGVIYAVYWRAVPEGYGVSPINLQFFPRPSEQWGWTCEARLGDDFDKFPFVWKYQFKHDLEASCRILARFSQGVDLFPPDPLSELAESVVNSAVLPKGAAELIVNDIIGDPHGKPGSKLTEIYSLLHQHGDVELSDQIVIPELERINNDLDRVWEQKRDSFFQGIGFRLVRTRKEREDDGDHFLAAE